MSNSIRRARSRPRVDSVNFRSFFWVLRLEAAYMVYSRWLDHRSRYFLERDRVPLDRAAIFVSRSLKLTREYPSLRRLP